MVLISGSNVCAARPEKYIHHVSCRRAASLALANGMKKMAVFFYPKAATYSAISVGYFNVVEKASIRVRRKTKDSIKLR